MKTMRFRYNRFSLLLAAILLLVAGGPLKGFAQTRFSANVVGYNDADFVAGSNLVANPFDAGNNTLSNLFAGVPSGSYFLPWDPVNRAFGPANQFTSQGGWTDGGAMLSVAQGGFLWLPAPKRISFVGEPWPPTCITFPMGDSVAGFMPQACCDWSAGGGQWNRDLTECVFQLPSDTVVEK